jgi:hypothetical protein
MPFARRGPFRPSSLSLTAVRPLPVLPGRGTLLRALAHALGNDRGADEFLRAVLWDAGMDAVPESAPAFEAFVREEILPRLMPMVRLDRLHDLVRRTIGEEGSLYPPPLKTHGAAPGAMAAPARRPRVVMVEPDAFRRISSSRELVRGGFDVEVVASADEVLRVDAFHALVMTLDDSGLNVARELAKRGTRAGLVIYDDPGRRDAVKSIIDSWPNDRVSVVTRDAAPAVLTSRVRIVTS